MNPACAPARAPSSFEAYLLANHRAWSRFPVPPTPADQSSVLIDLLVDHASYAIGNCVIGKYLQQHFGWRPIALVRAGHNGSTTRLAESFGIKTIVTHDDELSFNAKQDIARLFANQSMEEQRATLLGLKMNDVRIGDLVYDSYLRRTARGTIEHMGDDVILHTYLCLKDYIRADYIVQHYNVRASVQGHIVYSDFGSLARLVVRHGGDVFARKAAGGPFTLRRYRDLESLHNYEYVFSPQEFAAMWNTRRDEAIRVAGAFMQERMTRAVTNVSSDGVEAYHHSKRRYTKHELLSQLHLDPAKPTICIMSHVFSDAPHTFSRNLYDDYLLWLRATLELIKDMPHTNWLIKPHPDNRHYDPKHDAATEAQPYTQRHPHIALVPNDCNTASLFDVVDGVVTVCGTAGLEFPCWGIPSLNAGSSFYTGFGFTIEPATRDDYADALRRFGAHGRLTHEQRDRALVAAYLYYFASRVTCRYAPNVPDVFWIQRDENEIWNEAMHAVSTGTFWDDPLYQALAKQLHDHADHIMAPQTSTS